MLNIAAPEQFVLTLQSIPPFLIENILIFALVVLLAVPLIARVQLFFDNRGNLPKPLEPTKSCGRRLNHRNRHIIIHYPSPMVTTSRSSQSLQSHPMRVDSSSCSMKITDQSYDRLEDETEEDKEKEDEYTISNDQIMNFPYYEYQHYRHKLIKEHLKKNYGHFQAPGNVVLNSIHLSSIDSQRGIKSMDRHYHTLLNSVKLSDSRDETYGNKCLEYPELRDYFLTREVDDNLETIDRATETAQSSIDINKSQVEISEKERASTPTGSNRKQRPHCAKREKFSNDNTHSSFTVGSQSEAVDSNSRPNSARKLITKSFHRRVTPRSSPSTKKPVGIGNSIESNSFATSTHTEKTSNNSELTQKPLNKLKNSLHTTGIPVTTEVETAPIVEKPERPPSHAASVVGKCASVASSEAFSTCSSKNPERRLINARPGSSTGSGSMRIFRNLTSRVISRPKSSGATFAWDKPNVPGKVPSYEESTAIENTIFNAKRPKPGIASVNKKKSEVLSVLESIIDLSCDATIDFQESTDDMVIRNFREMSDDIVSSKNTGRSPHLQQEGKSHPAGNMKNLKSPVSSNQRAKTTSNNSSDNNRGFLLSRSGKYSRLSAIGQNRRKNDNQ